MEFQQLRYFCAVARLGSFTRAADELNISQPSLSEALKRLEANIGAELLARLGRSVKLTPQGELFLPHAQQVLNDIAEARRSVETRAVQAPSGKLIVGCIPSIMPYLIAPAIAAFLRQYPFVDLELTEDVTARLVTRLQNGSIDLAIAGLPVKNPDLLCGEILREPLLLAAGATSNWAGRTEVKLQELTSERILLLKEGHCFREDALSVCRRAKLMVSPAFEGDQISSILPLAASGYGVGIVPRMAAAPNAGCVFLPISPKGERRVGYLKLRRHSATQAERAFIAWLRSLTK